MPYASISLGNDPARDSAPGLALQDAPPPPPSMSADVSVQGADSHALEIVARPADRTSPPLREQARGVVGEPGSRSGSRKAATIPTWKWTAASLILALLGVLGLATTAHGQGPPSGPRATGAGGAAEAGPVVRSGVALYRGRELRYEVMNGMAVHGGDMVLGTVEEVVAEDRRQRSTKASTGAWPERRDLAPVEDEFLWPDGVIPYVIDPGFTAEAQQDIETAIHEWNSKTVITLVQRTAQADYVRFLPMGLRPSEPYCRASLGRNGGEQSVWLGSPDGCSVGATVHEIGHAVGLRHEHQRHDRDNYVTVSDAQSYGDIAFAYRADAPGRSSYDYASVMHYDDGLGTIPPGIPFGSSNGLSSGDIDGVARLYGTVPTATTITTNPAGLAILVDGESVTTPARFDWSAGSTHTLQALSPQTIGAERFVFGRWGDEGGSQRTVTAGPESTWFEANYIAQRRLVACAEPPEAGSVTVRPESRDGFHVQGQPVEVEAAPDGSREFLHWSPALGLRRHADRRSRGSYPGPSSNPASGATGTWSGWSSPGIRESAAIYTAKPTFLVDSNVEGIEILAGGERRRLPWAFPSDAYPDGIWAEAPATVPDNADYTDIRYRFKRWSDGGTRAHRIAVPASGGGVSLEVTRDYRLRERVSGGNGNTVSVSPPSEDGFYAEGTRVQVTANPGPGSRFAGWIGEVPGSEPSQAFVMDAAKWLEAVFTHSEPVRAGETKGVTLQPVDRFVLHNSYHVLVPPDATALTVRFQSSSAEEVDLYVHRGWSVRSEQGDAGETPRIHADFESASPGANETITINRESVPRLANDVYFIGFAVPPAQRQIEGTLSVEMRRSGIVKAWPPGLAFVSPAGSDPGPQTLRLTHQTTGTVRYRIVSNASWLTANPQEWVRGSSGAQEVSIMAHTAGVAQDTHGGKLTVSRASDGPGEATWTETGVEIPVALAVVPSNGSTSTSRRANAVAIDSRPQDGDTYGAGEEVRVDVYFADPVEVAGAPALDLEVGDFTRQTAWNGVGWESACEGGYKRLRFKYVVQADDRDADGISIGADALSLNGGSIRSAAGADAELDLGGHALADAAEHKVDGSIATPPKVSGVGINVRPQDGEAYGAGEQIRVWLNFSQPVEVDGTPMLALGVGGQTRQASFSGGAGVTLWFRYVVQAADRDADGISIGADALSLNGGSIRSAAGADAELDLGGHALADAAEHKVDGSIATPPKVSGVGINVRPQDGEAYGAGEQIRVWLNFSQPVEVDGTPMLALGVGGQTRQASFSGGADVTLWFRYVVQAADRDADGISIGADALSLNGGSIRSAAGADAELDLGGHALADAAEHKVDGSKATPPKVSGVGINVRPQDGEAYGAGEQIRVWLNFSQPVEVDGTPMLALGVGGQTRQASFSGGAGVTLWFRYVVQAADRDADGISIGADALSLNGGSIRSAAGADAELDLGGHALADAAEHKVDGSIATPPKVSGVGINVRPQDGEAYGAGEQIRVWLNFSQPVEVDGTPMLALGVGGQTRQASFSGGADVTLWFRYVVQAADRDADGISIGADALSLNGGSIRSAAGADAELDLGGHALADAAEHKVDGSKATPPKVSGVGINVRPQDGEAYGAGEQIRVWLNFSQPVEVDGTPMLALGVGGQTRQASFSGGAGVTLWFRYVVQAADRDADGISIGADALSLNGGSIRSAAGADAELDLGGHALADAAEHKVDGSG